MIMLRRTSLLVVILALCMPADAADVEGDVYLVGVAEIDITPDHPIRLNGFGSRRAESEGVSHKIYARALAIRHNSDKEPVLLITVEVLGITPAHRDELARRLRAKIAPERLAIAATHTHCAPMVAGANPTLFGLPIPAEHQKNIERYTAVFLDKLERVALKALEKPRPARLFWGIGSIGFAKNRRTAGGPTDHELPVLVARDAKTDQVLAIYTTYACHCVTLSHNKIDGDWAGYAAEATGERFPGAIAMVSIGCGADQNPDSGVTGSKIDIAKLQGRQIAEEVKRLLGGYLAPVRGRPICRLNFHDLPLAAHPDRKGWEELARRTDATGYHARVQLAKLDVNQKLATAIHYPVQTWAFGDSLAMVHLGGEVVVDYSIRLKTELDRTRVWIVGYANTNPGYIPSERVLKEGGYEGGGAMIYYDVPTPFKAGLEKTIVDDVKAQIGAKFACPFDAQKVGGSKPLPPQLSQRTLQTSGNLAVDLVAAEPLVASPVALAFGADGKLWVAEMLDYPSGKTGKFEPGGRIRFLEDTRGVGYFDRATTFLEGLPFPTGVLPWRKGVLVCSAPDILYAEDTAGDGKADLVIKLFSGFGTDNYQARVNGLTYGLDGWIYGSCGLFGGKIFSHKTGQTIALGDRDFRINPDTGAIEPATGRTQQGRVRNDWGDWFGCDNSDLAWHYALADHYLRRNKFVAPPNPVVGVPAGPDPNRLFPAGSPQLFSLSGPAGRTTAACGIGVYRDERLGAEYAGNVFTCEPANMLVHRLALKPAGVTFRGDRPAAEGDREFLASTDPWFRPVQAITGPDGGLWIADMYRFVIEHPRWIPATDLAKLDARAGAGMGRIYRLRRDGAKLRTWPRLDKLDAAGLVLTLDSPNGWQRDMATELLAWQMAKPAIPLLIEKLKKAGRPETRLHALAALARLGGLTEECILAALADQHPGVRRHAVVVSESFLKKSANVAQAVADLAGDADPQVRLQVACSLGDWESPRAGEALAKLVRRGDSDAFLSAAVFSSLNKTNFGEFVGRLPWNEKSGAALMPRLIATAVGLGDDAVMASLLDKVTRSENGYHEWQLIALQSLLEAWKKAPGPKTLPKDVSAMLVAARSAAANEKAATGLRVAAVQVLGRDADELGKDIDLLKALLAPQNPGEVQSAAVASLGRTADERAAVALIAGWPGYTPLMQSRVLGTLLSRSAWIPQTLAAIGDRRIPAAALSPSQRQSLLTHPSAAIKLRAEKIFAGAVNKDRQKVIDAYRGSTPVKGDAGLGREIFKKTCSSCHLVDGFGHVVGPDLAALATKSRDYLLIEILDPNRNLDNRYMQYHAQLTDGRSLTGLLAAEAAGAVTLKQADGKETTLLRADLESLKSTGLSLMPEGLEKDVSPAAMADLIAYLTSVATAYKKVPGNSPRIVRAVDGTLRLRAAECEIRGGDITFEREFGNIGFWHGATDYVLWRIHLDAAGEFDVYVDYACAPGSAGRPFALEGGEPTLRSKTTSTGAWSTYQWTKSGTIMLPAGSASLSIRPDTEILRGALMDLRTVFLVPKGQKPRFPGEK
jgi:putative membrane-bound dehydrogenase-like protein